jgi:hypothetical protein
MKKVVHCPLMESDSPSAGTPTYRLFGTRQRRRGIERVCRLRLKRERNQHLTANTITPRDHVMRRRSGLIFLTSGRTCLVDRFEERRTNGWTGDWKRWWRAEKFLWQDLVIYSPMSNLISRLVRRWPDCFKTGTHTYNTPQSAQRRKLQKKTEKFFEELSMNASVGKIGRGSMNVSAEGPVTWTGTFEHVYTCAFVVSILSFSRSISSQVLGSTVAVCLVTVRSAISWTVQRAMMNHWRLVIGVRGHIAIPRDVDGDHCLHGYDICLLISRNWLDIAPADSLAEPFWNETKPYTRGWQPE